MNSFFHLLFKNGNNDPMRDSFGQIKKLHAINRSQRF